MNILISIKKEYFDLINQGKKKYEYRFQFPEVNELTKIYIYIPKTYAGIYGYIKVKNRIWINKEDASVFYSNQIKDSIDAYNVMKEWTAHREGCYAMEILECKEFKKPLKYKKLKDNYDFNAPQNFIYIKQNLNDILNKTM